MLPPPNGFAGLLATVGALFWTSGTSMGLGGVSERVISTAEIGRMRERRRGGKREERCMVRYGQTEPV